MADKDYDPRRSSVAVGGDDEGGKRKLLPLLLGLLALGLLALVIGLVSCGDDEDESAAAPEAPTAPATTGTPSTSTPTAPTEPTATLTAGSASVLAGEADTIADNVGAPATGAGLEVLSVVESGFFVGTGDGDRQYVEFGGAVGEDENEQQLPAVGDVVGLKGEVRPAPADPAQTLKLEDADAQVVTDRGAYVNATEVTPAG